jgi:hypothetical protein
MDNKGSGSAIRSVACGFMAGMLAANLGWTIPSAIARGGMDNVLGCVTMSIGVVFFIVIGLLVGTE